MFSGDTRPCEAVVKAAQGATLLVHEATFEDGLEGEAVTKKHSTVSDAVTTGIKVWRVGGCMRVHCMSVCCNECVLYECVHCLWNEQRLWITSRTMSAHRLGVTAPS